MSGSGQSVDSAISRLAERQHGMVSRRQLLNLGMTGSQVARRVENERLKTVRRGVYAVGHRARGLKGVWMSAVLFAGPAAVLSHRSAASLWGLGQWRGPVEVASPRTGRTRGCRCRGLLPPPLVRRSSLDPSQVSVVDGIPATTVARTLVDLAAVLNETGLSTVLNEAAIEKVLDLTDLRSVLAASAGRSGIGTLRRLVELHHPQTGETRSQLEARFLSLLDGIDFERPRVNAVVEGCEVDAWWPDLGLVVELDSRRFHGTPRAFERDRERSARLELAGLRVLRLTWDMVVHRRRETERKLLAYRSLICDGRD